MTTLVKRGTARRLGLRRPDPLRAYGAPWIIDEIPPLRLSNRLPRADGIVYTGERWPG